MLEHCCLATMSMLRFLSAGFKVRPQVPPEPKRRAGRPPRAVPEGALDLGETRVRMRASKKKLADELRIAALEKKVESLQAIRLHDRDIRFRSLVPLILRHDWLALMGTR